MAKDNKKQKKNSCCQELANKVDIAYEILAEHKSDLESLELQIKEFSGDVGKVKGRIGL